MPTHSLIFFLQTVFLSSSFGQRKKTNLFNFYVQMAKTFQVCFRLQNMHEQDNNSVNKEYLIDNHLLYLHVFHLTTCNWNLILWIVASSTQVKYTSIQNCSVSKEPVQNDVKYWINDSNYFFKKCSRTKFCKVCFYFVWFLSIYNTLSILASTVRIRFMDKSSTHCSFFDEINEGNSCF